MIRKILLLLLIVSSLSSYGQKLILTSEENREWLNKLTALPIKEQVDIIRLRVLSDTNTVTKPISDKLILNESQLSKDKFEGCCKPFIIVNGFQFF